MKDCFSSYRHVIWSVFFLPLFPFLFFCNSLHAFPSSLYWTVATTEVVPTGKMLFEIDNYFTVFHQFNHDPLIPNQIIPPDTGLTLGLLSWGDWSMEVGIDYIGGTNYPWFFNAKIGIEENKLFSKAPSFSIGVYNIGTRAHITNFDIVDVIIGKTLPKCLTGGVLYLGGYVGTSTLGCDQGGYLIGYLKGFCDAKDCCGVKYQRWQFLADYASGKNAIGGGGAGIAYWFNSTTAVLTGPTWFNDADFNGHWKWTVQITVLFSVFDKCRKSTSNHTDKNETKPTDKVENQAATKLYPPQ